jgi:hypothetical protein
VTSAARAQQLAADRHDPPVLLSPLRRPLSLRSVSRRQGDTGQRVRMPPVLSLGGTRRGQALLASSSRAGPAAGASARPGRGWRPASPDGWRPWRSAWASVCSSRPIRFGFILAPGSSRPVCPQQQRNQTQSCPKGLPVLPGPLAARLGRARALPSWQAPRRACTGVCSTGCAWFRRHTPRPRAFHPGPRGAALLGGLSPADPSSPAHPSPLGGPVHGSCPEPGMGKRRVRQVRRSTHLAGSSSGHNG